MQKEARPSCARFVVPAAKSLIALAVFAASLRAAPRCPQFGPPPKPATVIRGGTIHVGNGDVVQNGTLILRGREIEAVGLELPVPEGATVIEAAGKHLYPGLIDVESNLLLDESSRASGEGNAASAVTDALDWFDRRALEEAWAGGVTTIGVASRHGLIDGARAVVKMHRARGDDSILVKQGDLSITLGMNGSRPNMRLREWKTLAETLDATKKYIEAWARLLRFSHCLGTPH